MQGALSTGVVLLLIVLLDTTASSASLPVEFVSTVAANSDNGVFNVINHCGAKGDGIQDDTVAFLKCINWVQNYKANVVGVLYIPPGSYWISSTLEFTSTGAVVIRGEGWASSLLWTFPGDLFRWNTPQNQPATEVTIQHLKIVSTHSKKLPFDNAALRFTNGVVRSLFDHILITYVKPYYSGSGLVMRYTTDSNIISQCQFWGIKGVGIQVGNSSEVRILGGRIIGDESRNDGSIGVHLTGNNGGVHIDSTDIIDLDIGVLIDNSSRLGANREVFLTHATLDSCRRGLAIDDPGVYVSIVGVWAASSLADQIWVAPELSDPGPEVVISGGTIFNGGVKGQVECDTMCNGITVNSGKLTISGTEIRKNRGKGVWVPNINVKSVVVTGSQIFGNGYGWYIVDTEKPYIITNNLCQSNGNFKWNVQDNHLVEHNVDCKKK